MEEVGGLIGAGVALLTTVGGGVAWILRRHDGKKDPIPKESAAVALSREAVGIMQGVADELRGDLASVRSELVSVRQAQAVADTEHSHTRRALEETRTDVEWLRSTLGLAASYIERLLHWARSDSRPPIPSLPRDLRNLIDPSLHDLDGTEEERDA